MEQITTRICELLVGLGDVDVVGVHDEATEPLVVQSPVLAAAQKGYIPWEILERVSHAWNGVDM